MNTTIVIKPNPGNSFTVSLIDHTLRTIKKSEQIPGWQLQETVQAFRKHLHSNS